jgi:hypothetical protein
VQFNHGRCGRLHRLRAAPAQLQRLVSHKCEGERAAPALLALDGNVAAVRLREALGNRQAQARAHALLQLPRLDLGEGREEALQVFGPDPHALISHADADSEPACRRCDRA